MKNIIYILIVSVLIVLPRFDLFADGEDDSGVRFTISGHIKDVKTGEDLIGATVYVKELKSGTTSNVYGYYALSLIPGNYTVLFSYVGFKPVEKTFDLKANITFDVELSMTSEELEEVVVTGTAINENVTRNEMSTISLDSKTISEIPALMGEVDIIKAIQLLPGVQTISEGSSGFSVRGGSMDQNLILLDEATVYNASHLMGFFSVFNNDAIKDVKLYKGDIPASAGGRLSSLLDVRMKDGNTKKFSGSGGIGTISSRLTLEGPIVKDKASFLVSGRRTYADIFIKLFGNEDIRDNRIYFYDLNAKLNYTMDEKNRLYASAYYGKDVFKNPDFKMGWGNRTFTLRWNHLFSQKIFSNFTFIHSDFDYELGIPEGSVNSFEWISNLSDLGGKADFTLFLNTNNTLRFGFSSTFHKFTPGTARGLGSEAFLTEYKVQNNNGLESAIYVSNEQKIGARLTLKYGLRFSHFMNVGESVIYEFDENYNLVDSTVYGKGKTFSPYYGLEPRVGATFLLNENSSVKGSYARTRQYIHLAQNSTAGTPLDVWFPSSPNVKPQIADQFALGYFRNFLNNTIEASAEAYYKHINNAIDFKDHADLLLNRGFEGELRFGEAWAYGIEFMVRYDLKKINGWVSYTLSKTERRIEGINNDFKYPATYDKPNDISIVVNYNVSKRISLGATWVYSTGSAVTFPTGRFVYGNKIVPIFSDRNSYRLPDYHRLDLSFTLHSKEKPERIWSYDWNFSLYNAYGRKNPWVINFVEEPANPNETYAEMIYLFSFVPSITFNFNF
ncbi:MAG: TonB-dependent receptor [Bacteroidales bacterium]|nr:TonB-dependent receptor [Bacteroidales bacterium]